MWKHKCTSLILQYCNLHNDHTVEYIIIALRQCATEVEYNKGRLYVSIVRESICIKMGTCPIQVLAPKPKKKVFPEQNIELSEM